MPLRFRRISKNPKQGTIYGPIKMFPLKEEKEPKRAKDEKEPSAKKRANERGKEREKENNMGI